MTLRKVGNIVTSLAKRTPPATAMAAPVAAAVAAPVAAASRKFCRRQNDICASRKFGFSTPGASMSSEGEANGSLSRAVVRGGYVFTGCGAIYEGMGA